MNSYEALDSTVCVHCAVFGRKAFFSGPLFDRILCTVRNYIFSPSNFYVWDSEMRGSTIFLRLNLSLTDSTGCSLNGTVCNKETYNPSLCVVLHSLQLMTFSQTSKSLLWFAPGLLSSRNSSNFIIIYNFWYRSMLHTYKRSTRYCSSIFAAMSLTL